MTATVSEEKRKKKREIKGEREKEAEKRLLLFLFCVCCVCVVGDILCEMLSGIFNFPLNESINLSSNCISCVKAKGRAI